MTEQIKEHLKELGFRPNEIKVYLGLTALGEAPASKVAKKIDLPRTTVISILEKLGRDGFLSEHPYRGTTYFWIESPKTLQQIFANKIKIAEELDGLLSNLYRAESDFPFAKIYDSKSSVRQFIERTLINLAKKSTIYTIDAPGAGNYEKIFSNDVGKTLIGLKNKRQILTKTLIPNGQFSNISPQKLAAQKIILREMPAEITFTASLWIIHDLIVLFSGKPPFVAAVKNKIINESIKSVYDFLWKISTPKN